MLASKNTSLPLKCSGCGHLIGIPIVYEKESRLAFHIEHGAVKKKKIPSRKRVKDCVSK
jgi:hypothetical protein